LSLSGKLRASGAGHEGVLGRFDILQARPPLGTTCGVWQFSQNDRFWAGRRLKKLGIKGRLCG